MISSWWWRLLMVTLRTSSYYTFHEMNSQELLIPGRLGFGSSKPASSVRHLQQIHAYVVKTRLLPLATQQLLLFSPSRGPKLDVVVSSIHVCHILNQLDNPQLCLDLCNAVVRNLSSNNSSSSSSNGSHRKSLAAMLLFREMLVNGVIPDNYTVPYVLKACAQSHALKEGVQIHAYSIKTGLLFSNVYVKNTLMRLYAVCGLVDAVEALFAERCNLDVVSWTILIQCYVKMGFPKMGVVAFFEMCKAKAKADEKTVVIVLSACSKLGDLSLGRKLHGYIRDNGVSSDVFVGNALIDMYLKSGDADSARELFDGMPVRNVVSWNSLISGLAHQGEFKEALNMFRKMQKTGLEPDDFTLVGVLNSCASLGVLGLGKWIHAYIDKNQIEADGFIGNALVDMYAKCGSIKEAYRVFREMKHRDVYSCTAIIVGLAMHGEANRALEVFSEMPRMGIKPDDVTFIGVLAACSHAGLVMEAQKYFKDMEFVYGLKPQMEHYGCMVDLLGRAGLIDEAKKFIQNMPIEPDASVWGALLGACKIHGKVELGEDVMKKLVKVEPDREGAYVLMSNLYSSANKWREAVKLRKAMKEKNMKKNPGCSSIELDGVVHEFRKGDKSHPKIKEIYRLLEEIRSQLNNYGHLAHANLLF